VIGVLEKGFSLLAVDACDQPVAKGLVSVLAVALDQSRPQRA
jgi:ABC-type xylose transport system permease subunit